MIRVCVVLLMLATEAHAVEFSGGQCRVMRQIGIGISQCHQHFASLRAESANYSTRTASTDTAPGSTNTASSNPGAPSRGPGTSNPGQGSPSQGAPGGGPGGSQSGGSPGSPPGSSSGSGNTGNTGNGSPGNPGGGDNSSSRPGEPLPTPPPAKPTIDVAALKALQDRARQAVRDRIIHGAKPPPSNPGKPNFDFDGKPPGLIGSGKPGYNPGPGGLRGASSVGTPSRDRNGQAR